MKDDRNSHWRAESDHNEFLVGWGGRRGKNQHDKFRRNKCQVTHSLFEGNSLVGTLQQVKFRSPLLKTLVDFPLEVMNIRFVLFNKL